jgi:imidazolonepropionase-like amidohydrolase
MFTAEGGYGMGEFVELPDPLIRILEQQMLRTPRSEDEALQQVRELYAVSVDAIKVVLEAGENGRLLPRLDVSILRAIAKESAIHGLPLIAHTASSRDVRDAVDVGARGVEHGSYRDPLPEDLIAQMVEKDVFYDPTLSLIEARTHVAGGVEELLERSLAQQVSPLELIEKSREALRSTEPENEYEGVRLSGHLEQAKQNLMAVYRNGVSLVAGSDAGNPLVLHGPTIHRELELWVEAGVPEAHALRAATANAARYLGAEDRLGLVAKGYEANLVLVDGNPLEDITATERISLIIFRGERIRRSALFDTF